MAGPERNGALAPFFQRVVVYVRHGDAYRGRLFGKKVINSSCKDEEVSVVYIPALSVTGQVAQLVEQGIENPRAGGSSPSLTTIEL